MKGSISQASSDLVKELKKDWILFGLFGLSVGALYALHDPLQRLGAMGGNALAQDLFEGVFSFVPFSVLFFFFLALGSFSSFLISIGFGRFRLDGAVDHVRDRLTQIMSSMLAFSVGLGGVALTHSIFSVSPSGLVLVAALGVLIAIMLCAYFLSVVVSRREKPFDTWWGAVILFVVALWAIGFIVYNK
ncbi:hypothetical protein [Thioalkalivibrio sp. ALJ7]|uniref:hypothetical protein n=1 Tax=Thioalkalivibrio sp. ALJ7 TaxID=1158756 RepID=UPI00037BA932|nr:hypothetical protein [Thioalkalivibrio sp. ALJ7]